MAMCIVFVPEKEDSSTQFINENGERNPHVFRRQKFCLSKFMSVIGSIPDVPEISTVFSHPAKDIILNITSEFSGAISCFDNVGQDSSKVCHPRVEITGNFVELPLIQVFSPSRGICHRISDELISIAYEFLNEVSGCSCTLVVPPTGI